MQERGAPASSSLLMPHGVMAMGAPVGGGVGSPRRLEVVVPGCPGGGSATLESAAPADLHRPPPTRGSGAAASPQPPIRPHPFLLYPGH